MTSYYYDRDHTNFNVPTKAEYELEKLLNNPNRKFTDVIMTIPPNDVVLGNVSKCWMKINSGSYPAGSIYVSISGGSDSDILLDMTRRCDPQNKCVYYFIDTGLESRYTKMHLDYLEMKYNVDIHRVRAKKPIPAVVRKEGIPFVSKQVSEFLMRLQRNGFQFEDESFEVLLDRYCEKATGDKKASFDAGNSHVGWRKIGDDYYRGIVSALQWWCNAKCDPGEKSKFDISRNKWLKEFILSEGGIPFTVANKCCQHSKKDTIHQFLDEESGCKLSIQGVRKSEGGARADAYKSCFNDASQHAYDEYRPVFWFLDQDKKDYNEYCGIKNSELYGFGLPRTGCSGCPFAKDIDTELSVFEAHEPNMKKAMDNVFGPSYEFTRKYHEFQKMMNEKEKAARKEAEFKVIDGQVEDPNLEAWYESVKLDA